MTVSSTTKAIDLACERCDVAAGVMCPAGKICVHRSKEAARITREANAAKREPKPRKQCLGCPWRLANDPADIPDGFKPTTHARLGRMSDRERDNPISKTLTMMACHALKVQKPCVGWLANQLGEGNNLPLRVAVAFGQIDGNVQTVGPQRERYEDVVPNAERE